jgi:hypothetical protein
MPKVSGSEREIRVVGEQRSEELEGETTRRDGEWARRRQGDTVEARRRPQRVQHLNQFLIAVEEIEGNKGHRFCI